MLAGGCVLAISQNQHLSAPCSHTSETIGAGTNVNLLVPIAGLLQELHILCGPLSSFLLLDSDTTVKVAKWTQPSRNPFGSFAELLCWRIVLCTALLMCIMFLSVTWIMVADPFTKYLPYKYALCSSYALCS